MDEEAMQRWQCGKRASEEAVAGFHDRIRAQTFNPSRYTVGVGGFRLNFKSFAIDISRTSYACCCDASLVQIKYRRDGCYRREIGVVYECERKK